MLQLNDDAHSLVDLTKDNLINIIYHSDDELIVVFSLEEVEIETSFTYDTVAGARSDYNMLLDMLSNSPTLLEEGIKMVNDVKTFAKERII